MIRGKMPKINFSAKIISLDKMENKLRRSKTISENISFASVSSVSEASSESKSRKKVIVQTTTLDRLKIPVAKNSDDKQYRRKKRARGLTHFIKKRNNGFQVNKLPKKIKL